MMAASRLQICIWRGKSWRTRGILYLSMAAWTMGKAWAQAGHSRSSNSKMATRAPAGGLTSEVSLNLFAVLGGAENWANAGTASRSAAARASRDEVMGVRRIRLHFITPVIFEGC